jgi:hypothetical protein
MGPSPPPRETPCAPRPNRCEENVPWHFTAESCLAIPDLAACARSRGPLLNLGLRLLGVPTTTVLRNPAGRADMLKGARGRRRMFMTGSDAAWKEVNSAILCEHSFFRRARRVKHMD